MASPQLQSVIQKVKEMMGNPPGSIQEFRAGFETFSAQFLVSKDATSTPVHAGGVPAEWISTPGAADDRVVLYLHGGGYVLGSVNTHREMLIRLSRAANARVLALNYRLAPEHPFPAAVEDATAAYRWLQPERPGRPGFHQCAVAEPLEPAVCRLHPLPRCVPEHASHNEAAGTAPASRKSRLEHGVRVSGPGAGHAAAASQVRPLLQFHADRRDRAGRSTGRSVRESRHRLPESAGRDAERLHH